MTEINRYEMNHKGLPDFDDKGVWVLYEDQAAIVAALQEQLSQFSMSAGHADQRKAESVAVRVALGFSADADDVAPCDLVDAIASLQEQVRALAAEAEALKNYIKSECFIMEVGAHPIAEADISAEERMPETPSTDAALREIRAQAVEGFAEHIAFYHSDSKSHALYYAARIREGEQP